MQARQTSWQHHGKRLEIYLPGMFVAYGRRGRYPAVSLTGRHCDMACDHCNGRLLETMLPATSPGELWEVARRAQERGDLGLLISGGSDRQGRLPSGSSSYQPSQRIKRETGLILTAHVARIDETTAKGLKAGRRQPGPDRRGGRRGHRPRGAAPSRRPGRPGGNPGRLRRGRTGHRPPYHTRPASRPDARRVGRPGAPGHPEPPPGGLRGAHAHEGHGHGRRHSAFTPGSSGIPWPRPVDCSPRPAITWAAPGPGAATGPSWTAWRSNAGVNALAVPSDAALEAAKELGLEVVLHDTCCSVYAAHV